MTNNKTIFTYVETSKGKLYVMRIHGRKNSYDVIIDPEFKEQLEKHTWYVKHHNRAIVNENGTSIRVFIFGRTAKEGHVLTSVNRNYLDNRKSNITEVTWAELALMKNTNKSTITGVKGVVELKYYYQAHLRINGKLERKFFNKNQYGVEEAFKLAVAARRQMEIDHGLVTEDKKSIVKKAAKKIKGKTKAKTSKKSK